MKVIIGRTGRIIKMNELINMYDDVLIVTTKQISVFGFPYINKKVNYLEYDNSSAMWSDFIDDKLYEEFITKAQKYDAVVFYILEDQDEVVLDNYGAIEDRIGKQVIVTFCSEDDVRVIDL